MSRQRRYSQGTGIRRIRTSVAALEEAFTPLDFTLPPHAFPVGDLGDLADDIVTAPIIAVVDDHMVLRRVLH